jgi:hypothetical protein
MPINPNVLPSPEPDEPEPTPTGDRTGDAEVTAPEEPPKRTRRKKSEMIADAVIPAADEAVEIKDSGTGAKVQRPWTEAVALVKAEKAEFTDRAHHYAMLKADQQEASPAFEPDKTQKQDVRYDPGLLSMIVKTGEHETQSGDVFVAWSDIHGGHSGEMVKKLWDELPRSAPQDATDETGMRVAPEEAALGDEVVVGAETYVVGHGRRLVQGIVEFDGEPIIPQRRWQRASADGPWESVPLTTPTQQQAAEVKVETEKLPRTVEQVDDGSGVLTWKIGTGILEKIGMPNYSSFQIGPITASRMVVDDGRRTVVPLSGGREGSVPSAVIEAFEEADNTVEFIAARFRGQLQSFLQATGALTQPTS